MQLNYKKQHKLLKAAKKRKRDQPKPEKDRQKSKHNSTTSRADVAHANTDDDAAISDQDIIAELLS